MQEKVGGGRDLGNGTVPRLVLFSGALQGVWSQRLWGPAGPRGCLRNRGELMFAKTVTSFSFRKFDFTIQDKNMFSSFFKIEVLLIHSVSDGQQSDWVGRTDAEAEAPIFWPPDTKSQVIGKMLGKIEGKRRRRRQRMRWLDSITNSMDMNLSKLQKIVEDKGARFAAVHAVVKSRTRLSEQQPPRFLDLCIYLFCK